jgi:hypothetical protein
MRRVFSRHSCRAPLLHAARCVARLPPLHLQRANSISCLAHFYIELIIFSNPSANNHLHGHHPIIIAQPHFSSDLRRGYGDRYPSHEITLLRRFRHMSSDCLTDRLLIDMIKSCGKGKVATFWSVVGCGKLCFSRS